MNRLIMCEGKTDAILLGYYLMKTGGWEFCRKAPEGLRIKAYQSNENVAWYGKNDEWLLICAVGGKDNFAAFFKRDIQRAIINADAFSRIAVIVDRDDRGIAEIESDVSKELPLLFASVQNRSWNKSDYTNAFGIGMTLETLLLIVPAEHQGALENVMLDAISEDPYDKNIVEQCASFVADIRPDAERYITSNRLQLKATLSTVWAIQSPEKVFDFIDAQIRAVEWERYETLHECFGILRTI